MGLPAPDSLAAAPLSIVVFGPGFGEAIMLRAARDDDAEWAVVDCARRERRGGSVNPVLKLLQDCGARPSLVVLTHPHADHTGGMAAVVQRAAADATVGCVEPLMDSPSVFAPEEDPDDLGGQRRSETRLAHVAIKRAWDQGRAEKWPLVAGTPHGRLGDWTITVLNPGHTELDAAVEIGRAGGEPNLNDLSAALLLERDGVRIAMAADCEADAWVHVEARINPQHLRETRPIKVPHHGSKGAIHPVLIDHRRLTADRPQVATPFPRSGRLPRFEPGQGAELLLDAAGELLLTALPVDLVPLAEPTRIAEVRDAMTVEDFAGDAEFSVRNEQPASTLALGGAVRDPFETWVLLGVHPDGRIDVTLGEHALRLVP